MSSVNKVILIGHLGKDPEPRFLPDGKKMLSLSVATSEYWKDKNTGERKDRTEWHNVSIMNERLVDVAEKYLRKGSKVYIEGQLQTRKWNDSKTGVERYTTDVVLRQFKGDLTLLDSKNSSGEMQTTPESNDHNTQTSMQNNEPQQSNSYDNGLNDQIPW